MEWRGPWGRSGYMMVGRRKVEGSKRLLSERRGMTRKESEFVGRRVAEESRAGICGVAGSVGAARVGAESGGMAVQKMGPRVSILKDVGGRVAESIG